MHVMSFLNQNWCRNALLVADGLYLNDGLKQFDHESNRDERGEHVLRDAEVKYCFQCGENREFKCCHVCFQIWCDDSAKVTEGLGGDKLRVFQGSKGWTERFSGKHIDGMSNVAYRDEQGYWVSLSQVCVVSGDSAACNVDEKMLAA